MHLLTGVVYHPRHYICSGRRAGRDEAVANGCSVLSGRVSRRECWLVARQSSPASSHQPQRSSIPPPVVSPQIIILIPIAAMSLHSPLSTNTLTLDLTTHLTPYPNT